MEQTAATFAVNVIFAAAIFADVFFFVAVIGKFQSVFKVPFVATITLSTKSFQAVVADKIAACKFRDVVLVVPLLALFAEIVVTFQAVLTDGDALTARIDSPRDIIITKKFAAFVATLVRVAFVAIVRGVVAVAVG